MENYGTIIERKREEIDKQLTRKGNYDYESNKLHAFECTLIEEE